MLRRSCTLSCVATSSPSIRICPEVGSTIRLIIRSSVVLPHPEEPTNTVVLCEGRTKLKSSTATVPSGNRLVTERNSIMVAHPVAGLDRLSTASQPTGASNPAWRRSGARG